jgi:hypothetical protein
LRLIVITPLSGSSLSIPPGEDRHRAPVGLGDDPVLRPEYHPTYYRVFVLDPDGNNIEAVRHGPVKEV